MPKIYLEDVGVRNTILTAFQPQNPDQQGQIVENFVYNQLRKNYPGLAIKYWRTKSGVKVHFIVESVPIEVKYAEMKRPVLPSGLCVFISAYPVEQAYILTKNLLHREVQKNSSVIWLPV